MASEAPPGDTFCAPGWGIAVGLVGRLPPIMLTPHAAEIHRFALRSTAAPDTPCNFLSFPKPPRHSGHIRPNRVMGHAAVAMPSSASAVPRISVDTEQMLGRLDEDGYQMVDSVDSADFVVVNTCGFIDSAREESLGAIDEMLALKRQGKIRNVVVTGCLAERQQGKLLESRPEIDAMVGVFGRNEIVSVIERLRSGVEEQQRVFRPAAIRPLSDAVRRADHAPALRLPEDQRRLRPALHLLRDSQDAGQTLQQTDRASRRGS